MYVAQADWLKFWQTLLKNGTCLPCVCESASLVEVVSSFAWIIVTSVLIKIEPEDQTRAANCNGLTLLRAVWAYIYFAAKLSPRTWSCEFRPYQFNFIMLLKLDNFSKRVGRSNQNACFLLDSKVNTQINVSITPI